MVVSSALRVVVVVLAVLLSGAPRALASVLEGGEPRCATPCAGEKPDSDHEKDKADDVCSPICSTGPCAKVFSSIASAMFMELEVAIEGDRELVLLSRSSATPDGVSGSVFHPPRA